MLDPDDETVITSGCLPEDTDVIESGLVRLSLITHNARLVDARKDRGLNGQDMAQACHISRNRLREIENLRVIPSEDEIIKFACILEKAIDDLFPEELLSAIGAGVFARRKVELSTPQVISLTEAQHQGLLTYGDGEMTDEIDRKLLEDQIGEVLATLQPRQQKVLKLRFGLEDGPSLSLTEAGKELNVTKERIRQIEAKALRNLRHPSRTRGLEDFLDISGEKNMRILGVSAKWEKLKSDWFTTFRFQRMGKDWEVGEVVQVVYKPRSKEREILGTAQIGGKEQRWVGWPDKLVEWKEWTRDITITAEVFLVSQKEAKEDGFAGVIEMVKWMSEKHEDRNNREPMNKLTLYWLERR